MKKTIIAASISTLLALASASASADTRYTSGMEESQVPMCNGVVVAPDYQAEEVLLSTPKKVRAEAMAGVLKQACEGGGARIATGGINGGIFSQQWDESSETMLTACQGHGGESYSRREITISFHDLPHHTFAKFRTAGSNCAQAVAPREEVQYLQQFAPNSLD